jgi:hypothetical protein
MVENELEELPLGGEGAEDGRRRRFWRFSSRILEPAAVVD